MVPANSWSRMEYRPTMSPYGESDGNPWFILKQFQVDHRRFRDVHSHVLYKPCIIEFELCHPNHVRSLLLN
jgi:hypothetical protein